MHKFVVSAMVLVAMVAAGAVQAQDLEFKLVNKTSSPLIGFYVSHVGTNDWEENLLQGAMLDTDYEVQVVIQDGRTTCDYDIRGEFEDGDTVEERDLDLCELGEYTFSD